MNKVFVFLFFFCFAIRSFGQSNQKVVLGIAPLSNTKEVKDKYSSMVLASITEQASKIKELNFLSRSPKVTEEILKEIKKTLDPASLDAEVLAKVGKQLGATYLLLGEISAISIEKVTVPGVKGPFNMPIKTKQVTVIMNLNIANVETGKIDASKQISSNILPEPNPITGEEKAVQNKIDSMSSQFNEFLQTWFNEKTGTSSAKAN